MDIRGFIALTYKEEMLDDVWVNGWKSMVGSREFALDFTLTNT